VREQTLSDRMSALLERLEETREILFDLVDEAENLEYDLDTETRTTEDQAAEIESLQTELREAEVELGERKR
jgi:chromosome segregation ATPase